MRQNDAKEAIATIERLALAGYSVAVQRGPGDEWTVHAAKVHVHPLNVGCSGVYEWSTHAHNTYLIDALRAVDVLVSERKTDDSGNARDSMKGGA